MSVFVRLLSCLNRICSSSLHRNRPAASLSHLVVKKREKAHLDSENVLRISRGQPNRTKASNLSPKQALKKVKECPHPKAAARLLRNADCLPKPEYETFLSEINAIENDRSLTSEEKTAGLDRVKQ